MTSRLDLPELLFEEVVQGALDHGFVERAWLAELVQAHLDDPGCRFVLLQGGPGTGKTSFVAWLARRYELSPRYFVRRDSTGTLAAGDARSVLLRVGHQLAALAPGVMGREITAEVEQRVGEVAADGTVIGVRIGLLQASPFRGTALRVAQSAGRVDGSVVGVQIDRLVTDPRLRDLGDLQYLALLDPALELARREPGSRIVVLLDAVDEVGHRPGGAGEDVLDWLAQCPRLPGNVRVVITSRPGERLRGLRARQREWLREETITDSAERVAGDLRAYTSAALDDPAVAAVLSAHPAGPARLARRVVERADGNFLYLVLWVQGLRRAIAEGDDRRLAALTDFTALPGGLTGIYECFLTLVHDAVRLANGPGWRRVWREAHRPLLGALAVARGPLTLAGLARAAGLSPDDPLLPEALGDLTEFLIKEGGGLRLCHASLGEFLTEPPAPDERPPWYVNPFQSNLDLARRYVAAFGTSWQDCDDDYALAHTASHGVRAVEEARTDAERSRAAALVASLLSDPSYGLAKAARLGTEEMLLDYVAAHAALDGAAPEHREALVRGLASAVAARAAATDEHLPDVLHSVLGYHGRAERLNEAVLVHLTDAATVGESVADPRKLMLTTLGFAHGNATRLRRLGDGAGVRKARDILERAVSSTERLGADLAGDASVDGLLSSICYDLAYVHYLYGETAAADGLFRRSAEAADRAGNATGAYISRLVALRMNLFAGTVGAARFRADVEDARTYFAERAEGPHARRWAMNVHQYLIDLAVETGDPALAGAELEALEEDEWLARLGRDDLLRIARARVAFTRGDHERAAALYGEHLAAELTGEPSGKEELARDLLHYGRALAALGRAADARRAWAQGLRCPDHTANGPWKHRIERELSAR